MLVSIRFDHRIAFRLVRVESRGNDGANLEPEPAVNRSDWVFTRLPPESWKPYGSPNPAGG